MTIYSAALESKFTALKDCVKAERMEVPIDASSHLVEHVLRDIQIARRKIPNASAYYWSTAIAEAVRASSVVLPADTSLSLERYNLNESNWFWFERPFELSGIGEFQGILWFPLITAGERRLYLTAYADMSGYLWPKKTLVIKDRADIAGVIEESRGFPFDSEPLTRFFLAALVWLDQEILVAPSFAAQRACRRRLAKEGLKNDGMIKVVHLRRTLTHHGQLHSNVEFSCQWLVKGHWRQQFYPSTGERRPIWILPHVKGPEGAPFKAPSTTVFAVTR